jgi:hypothetical protein
VVVLLLLLLPHQTTQTPEEPSCLHRHRPLPPCPAVEAIRGHGLRNGAKALPPPLVQKEQKDDSGNPEQRQARQLLFCKILSTSSQYVIWKDIPIVPVVETLELAVKTQTRISKPQASVRKDTTNDIYHC